MSTRHTCFLLNLWLADPSVPIEFDEESRKYVLIVNADIHVTMVYCPFCGRNLNSGRSAVARRGRLCKHLAKLEKQTKSSIIYWREQGEYAIAGHPSRIVRLFYCPICGNKLPPRKNGKKSFYRKSPIEIAKLSELVKGVATPDQVLERLGPPDIRRGSSETYLYLDGKRVPIGCKWSLFYEHLAKTVEVVVSESLDGRVEVRFFPKEKRMTHSHKLKPMQGPIDDGGR